jgi:Na+/H+ antiporter NhaC
MTNSLRWLLALAFGALYFVLPTADRGQLAFLDVRKWLSAEDDSQLAAPTAPFSLALHSSGKLPPLAADWQVAGSESVPRATREADCGRIQRAWARSAGREVDTTLPAIGLRVRVGDNGHLAELITFDGSPLARREVLAEPRAGAVSDAFLPDRNSLLPALVAIALAILTRRIIPSLLIGAFVGAFVYLRGDALAAAHHLLTDTIWNDVLRSQFNQEVMGFVVFLFMTVGVMARSGGILGMVEWVRRFARGPVSTQLCSWIIGILIFFDDYSNCIIAGSTMRPLTDRNGVSREKLAYIVDSTAAPVAGISIFSTWIAYEVSMFAPQLPEVTNTDGNPYTVTDGFAVFVETLPVRFYCIFTLGLVLLTILMRRELGPMFTAERRARTENKPVADDARPMVADGLARTEPPPGAPQRGINALLPIMVLITATIALIYRNGSAALSADEATLPLFERIPKILGNGESQRALFHAAILAFVVACVMALAQRILGLVDVLLAALRAAQSLIFAVVILVLAWTIGEVCKSDLGTASFLTAAFHGSFSPVILPLLMFLTSALVAFSTGTSYGTMAILLPNVVVLAHTMGSTVPELGGPALMILTIGAVLEGSIFGDHCSPISDTTVLSSVACGSDHLHHVRTQAPYAILGFLAAAFAGYLPAVWFGPSIWPICWVLGFLMMAAVLWFFGKDPGRVAPSTGATRDSPSD